MKEGGEGTSTTGLCARVGGFGQTASFLKARRRGLPRLPSATRQSPSKVSDLARETHGFAPLLHSRFALIGAIIALRKIGAAWLMKTETANKLDLTCFSNVCQEAVHCGLLAFR